MPDFISFAYAATVAAGGIMGYVKAGKIITIKLIKNISTE